MTKQKKLCLVLLTVSWLAAPDSSQARDNLASGSITLRQEYDSNTNLTEQDRESAWYSILSPALQLTSTTPKDRLLLRYAPGLRINQHTDEHDIDHDLYLSGNRQFSEHLRAGINERYFRSDDSDFSTAYIPDETELVPEDERARLLSIRRARQRFWTNAVSTRADYEYAEESLVSLAYAHRQLENKNPADDDYVRHNPTVSVSRLFNQNWLGEAGYSYIHGDFDREDDLETHGAHLMAAFRRAKDDTYSATYKASTTDYDGTGNDYDLHTFSLGWQHAFNSREFFSISYGIPHLVRENASDETGFRYTVDFKRLIRRGSMFIKGSGGFDEMQFDGAGDTMARFWMIGAGVSYELFQDLTGSLSVAYRENELFDRAEDENEKILSTGAGLQYRLNRWLTASAGYSFRQLEADPGGDDYDDHRIFMAFSAARDLARW